METEYRTIRRLAGDPPPEGWRQGTSWLLEDGRSAVLYTNAPEKESPYDHDYVFVHYRPVRQKRQVTEWEDC